MKYFISSRTAEWNVDANRLMAQLQSRWPDVNIVSQNDPVSNQLLTWSYTSDAGLRVDGALTPPRDCIVLEGDIADCAAFAFWLRDEAPGNDADLLFYDEGFCVDVQLRDVQSPSDLVARFAVA